MEFLCGLAVREPHRVVSIFGCLREQLRYPSFPIVTIGREKFRETFAKRKRRSYPKDDDSQSEDYPTDPYLRRSQLHFSSIPRVGYSGTHHNVRANMERENWLNQSSQDDYTEDDLW